MEHILELYSQKKRYWSMDFGVKMVDFLVEHKRLTKIGVKQHKQGETMSRRHKKDGT